MRDSTINGASIIPTEGANATPEGAALILLQLVSASEQQQFGAGGADKKWILETYAECLRTVHNA